MDFIEKIKQKVKNDPDKCRFYPGIDLERIKLFETAYGVQLPESYVRFITTFGGGLITEFESYYYIDMTDFEPDSPKMTSFYFFDFDELCEERLTLYLDNYLVEKDFDYNYPFIPIGKTPCQEYIFLVSEKLMDVDSPVLMSLNNHKSDDVKHLGNSFTDFMESYIKKDGLPPIPDIYEPGAKSNFLRKFEILSKAREKETEDEAITRCNALIELEPDDPWNYNERASALLKAGQRMAAIDDINKAIEMNPKEGFFYYHRGNLLSEYGSNRKALIDLDIAVKLSPDDNLLRSARAEVFYKLGKLDKALEDCNIIIEKDWRYELALSTRCRVYRAMGDDEKADADSELLDDLWW